MINKSLTCVLLGTAISMALATTTHARVQECSASWYGPGFHGRKMANGQPFNQNNPVHLAHKSLPFGTELKVTNLQNGRSIIARVTDRGPYIKGRCVDLSKAGAERLGFLSRGHAPVRVQTLN